MADKPQLCPDCRRTIEVCRIPVDRETWPQAAVDSYDLAGYTGAATCPRGQLRDLRATTHGPRPGWCIDRIVRHSGYRGEPIPGLQRDVQGATGRKLGATR